MYVLVLYSLHTEPPDYKQLTWRYRDDSTFVSWTFVCLAHVFFKTHMLTQHIIPIFSFFFEMQREPNEKTFCFFLFSPLFILALFLLYILLLVKEAALSNLRNLPNLDISLNKSNQSLIIFTNLDFFLDNTSLPSIPGSKAIELLVIFFEFGSK